MNLSYVAIWTGSIYAFLVEGFFRRIARWRVSDALRAELALDPYGWPQGQGSAGGWWVTLAARCRPCHPLQRASGRRRGSVGSVG